MGRKNELDQSLVARILEETLARLKTDNALSDAQIQELTRLVDSKRLKRHQDVADALRPDPGTES